MRIFEEDKLQHGAAPAGPERIIHTVKAAFSVDKENTAVLVYPTYRTRITKEAERRC